jgi:hypothetical protein
MKDLVSKVLYFQWLKSLRTIDIFIERGILCYQSTFSQQRYDICQFLFSGELLDLAHKHVLGDPMQRISDSFTVLAKADNTIGVYLLSFKVTVQVDVLAVNKACFTI